MNKFIEISLFCLLVKVVDVFGNSCRNGASCITLSECKGLHDGTQRNERAFFTLFRLLHCGINGTNGNSMVCCPSEFRDSILLSNTTHTEDVINPVVNLLPNTSVCGVQNTDILYGSTRTEIDEHPWVALIRYRKPTGSGFHCGGVLISSQYVLTAAHCIKSPDLPYSWTVSQVRLGEWNKSSEVDCYGVDCAEPAVDVDVEEVIPHSQYDPRDDHQQNDIALLRLAKNVPFSDFIKPICLPNIVPSQNIILEGRNVEIVGWDSADFRSDIKLKGSLPVVNQSLCRNVYKRVGREITETQLCAGGKDSQVSCRGDSGGPLLTQMFPLYNWIVIGVKSYGAYPCGSRGWPTVYTRVTAYMDWIVNNMKP